MRRTTVTLYECRKLRIADEGPLKKGVLVQDTADPFVIIFWNGVEVARTPTQYKTTKPKFEFKIVIDTPEPQLSMAKEDQGMRVEVFDEDPDGNNDFMGLVNRAEYEADAYDGNSFCCWRSQQKRLILSYLHTGVWKKLRRKNCGSDKKTKKYNKYVGGDIRLKIEHQLAGAMAAMASGEDPMERMLRESREEEERKMASAMEEAMMESGGGGGEDDHWKKLEAAAIAESMSGGGEAKSTDPWAAGCTDCGATDGLTESAEWAGYFYCEACSKAYTESAPTPLTEEALEQHEAEKPPEEEVAPEIDFSGTDSDEDRWKSSDSFRSIDDVEHMQVRATYKGRGRAQKRCLVRSYTPARLKLGLIEGYDSEASMSSVDQALLERLMLEDMSMGDDEEERNKRMMEMLMNEDAEQLARQDRDDAQQQQKANEPYGLAADGSQLFEAQKEAAPQEEQQGGKKVGRDRRRTALETDTVTGIKLEDLQVVSFLGAGSFGNVTLVRSTKDSALTFALKQVSKHFMVEKKMVQDVKMERITLMTCTHPFIVHLHATFQDKSCLYFLMEVVEGPALHHVIQHPDKFAPNYPQPGLSARQARFYAACLISALQHMGMKGVVSLI
jgi:hypothetical protein